MSYRKAVVVFIIIFILFTSILLPDEELRCSICRKTVQGEYFKSGKKIFCSERCVLASKSACTVCGKRTLKGGFRLKGKFVCSEKCLNALRPKCTICGKPVKGGKGMKSEGKFYCSDRCFKKALPVCLLCGKRIMQSFRIKNRIYCVTCSSMQRCIQCGLPADGEVLPDRRPMCRQCKKEGIVVSDIALERYLRIRKLLKEKFNIETDDDITFHLVDMKEFRKVNESDDVNESGLYKRAETVESTTYTFFGINIAKEVNRRTVVKKDIYILNWLNRQHFQMIAAHELMHDWTQENFPQIEDLRIIEGLSEYMAYLVCKHFGYKELMEKIENNQALVYSEGFRLVKSADKGRGLTDIIKWLGSGEYKKALETKTTAESMD